MRNLFTVALFLFIAFSANAEICTITLSGDWSSSSLRIKEPTTGVDTIITGTADVWFRGTGNATFLYSGINSTNTFEYLSCAGYDFTSPVLTDGDVYISAGVLPVELTFFKSNVLDGSVILNWQTASEENNKGFEVEHSTDGFNFEGIGFVDGNGTSLKACDYIYIDYEVSSGVNYYRLKQLDFDGKYEYSNIVYSDLGNSESETRIFGNVVENELRLSGSGVVLIVNSLGRVVKELQLTESNIVTVDVSTFAKGIYYIRLKNETLRFVKI